MPVLRSVISMLFLLFVQQVSAAISHVQEIGTFSGYFPSSVSISVTAPVASGNSVIVTLAVTTFGVSPTVSCSDSKGNSYTTDVSHFSATNATVICAAHGVTALAVGDTIDVSLNTPPINIAVVANEFSGLEAGSALDQTATGVGNSTTPASAATSTTTQADELLIGAIGVFAATPSFAPGTDFVAAGSVSSPSGSYPAALFAEYRTVSGTGSYLADGALSADEDWIALIATYKAATGTAITVSGTLYSDEGTTPLAGQTVRLIVAGSDVASAVTDGSGNYTFSATIDPANPEYVPLLVYVDDGSVRAVSATVMDLVWVGPTLSNLDLYADHLIVRQEDSSWAIDNGDLSVARGAYADADIFYSVSGLDLSVSGTDTELYVPPGHTYRPSGKVAVAHLKIRGTVIADNSVFTIGGDWDHSAGTFNRGTSMVNFTGSGTITVSGAWWTKPFYNVTAAAAGQTTTILAGQGIAVENDLVLGSGTLAGGDVVLNKSAGTPLTTSATLSNSSFMYSTQTTGTVYVTPASYPDLRIAGWTSGATNTFQLAGNISCNTLQIAGTDAGSLTILDTGAGNHAIDCSSLEVGAAWDSAIYNRLVLNGSSVTISGAVTIHPSDTGGSNEIDAGSAIIRVGGDWTNEDTFIAGTSSVILDGSAQSIVGSTTFHHLTKTVTVADTLTFTAGTTQTVAGTATLQGASGQLLALRSSSPGTRWNLQLASGAIKAISHVDVMDSDASGSDPALLDINPGYSVDSGNNVRWFGNANITVTKSSIVISDPVNGTVNPKRIPGAVVEYTILVIHAGGAQATNVTITDDLGAEAAVEFLVDGYAPGRGMELLAPDFNGGVAAPLTNVDDGDPGDYGVTAPQTITVGGITLDAGEQARLRFRVRVR